MEGAGTFSLGAQSSPTREAQCPSQIRLVGTLRARLTGFEPIAGEVPGWTLAWVSFVEHRKGSRVRILQKDKSNTAPINRGPWTLSYLRRRRCFVLRLARGRHCRGIGHRLAAPPSPGKCQADTGHSAPAHHGNKTLANI